MNLRSFPALAVLCLSSIGSLLQAQSAVPISQLFVFGNTSTGTQVAAYPATAVGFGSVQAISAPSAPFQVLPGNGRFYVLANTGSTGILSVDAQFQNARTVGNLSSPPSAGAVSPDQKRLVIGAGNIYVFDITGATETILSSTGIPVTGSILDIAVSLDSTRAFILTASSTASYVYAVNLLNGSAATTSPLQLPGGATGIATAPNGWLYLSATNRFYEINGTTLQVRTGGEIGLVGKPNRPVFTPDGHYAIMTNTTPLIGNVSMYLVDLISRGSPIVYPPSGVANTAPLIDKVLVVNNNRFLVFSSQATSIFEGTVSPFNLLDATALGIVTSVHNVSAAAVSNELPQAKSLYIVITNQTQNILQRIDLTNNSVNGQAGLLSSNVQLQFGYVPTTLNPVTTQQINDNQVLPAGSASVPLIVRVTDAAGRPVYNVPVTFATASAAIIATANTVTSGDGFASTTVTAPTTPGAFQISATIAGIAAPINFSLSVPGSGGGGGGGPTAGGTFLYSGNGQLALELSVGAQDLVVIVKDGKGQPVVGETVNWTVSSGNVGVRDISSITDSNGIARTSFGTANVNPGIAFQSSTINASSSYGSVDFIVTTTLRFLIGGGTAPNPSLELYVPNLDTNKTITVAAGTTKVAAVQAHAAALAPPQAGAAMPNIGLRVNLIDTGADLVCANGTVPLTDATGLVTCDLVAPCKLGFSNLQIFLGEFGYFNAGLQVTAGSASGFQILTGNNQTGTAGQPLPLNFLAIVTDACGTPVSGQNVSWKVATGSGTLSKVVNVSDFAGRVSALLTAGATSGVTTVTVSATGPTGAVVASATFTATINVTVSSITPVSGGGQTTFVNTTFAQPLVVQVSDAQGKAVSGFPVTFALASGNASISSATANTDANGRASTNVTAGSVAGNIVITAAAGNFSTSFGLTSTLRGPSITPQSFMNAASFQVGLTPCGLSTVIGSGLATNVQGTVLANQFLGPMPLSLAGVDLTVNGIPAPISSVSNIAGKEQVNFQTPCEAVASSNGVVVVRANGSSTTINGVLISQYQPGLFEYTASNNVKYAAIQKENGSYVTTANPAHRGDKLRMFVTGIGQTNPPMATNQGGIVGQTVAAAIVVGVNGAGTQVISAEALPVSIGVYMIVFTVPDNAPLNDTKVIAAVGLPNNGGLVVGNESNLPIR